MTNSMRIGFIGIGNMGAPMASHIAAAGYSVTVYDADAGKAADYAARTQVAMAQSLRALGEASDIVITMLPNDRIVRSVMLGENGDGVLSGLRPGAVLVDMSSSAPEATRILGKELAAADIGLVDAPVSGGVPRAVKGNLAIMMGGAADVIARVQPVLETMGTPSHVGPLGSGHAAKVLNNLVSAAGLAAAAEAVVVGRKFGIAPDVLVDVLNASTGRNNSTENKFKQFILNDAFNSGFALSLMVKDLTLALEVAEQCGVSAELSHACLDVWRKAQAQLPQEADHTAIATYAGWTGQDDAAVHSAGATS